MIEQVQYGQESDVLDQSGRYLIAVYTVSRSTVSTAWREMESGLVGYVGVIRSTVGNSQESGGHFMGQSGGNKGESSINPSLLLPSIPHLVAIYRTSLPPPPTQGDAQEACSLVQASNINQQRYRAWR
jgi:hypothetical protein